MSTSPLDPQEIRAAAGAHNELGPEYSDAVIESVLERVDRKIDARIDARLRPAVRERPAPANSTRALLTGVAIGIVVTGVPSMAVAIGAGGVIPGDEKAVLIVLAILWAIAVGIGAYVYPAMRNRRKDYGVRETGHQAS